MSEPTETPNPHALPEIPRSWFIFFGIAAAAVLLGLKVIDRSFFEILLGLLLGGGQVNNATGQKKTAQIAAQGSAPAVVAALKSDPAVQVTVGDEEPPTLRGGS